jgi:hypothetical protein
MGGKKKKTGIKEMETLVEDFKATFDQMGQEKNGSKAELERDAKGYAENRKKGGA